MVISKFTRVGGPLLGRRTLYDPKQKDADPISWGIYEPFITSGEEPFILLPNRRFVSVISYATGKTLASLIPWRETEDENDQIVIESASLAKFFQQKQESHNDDFPGKGKDDFSKTEEVLLLGCRDGTIREFCLSDITLASNNTSKRCCQDYSLNGTCIGPRRVFDVCSGSAVLQLAAPSIATKDGVIIYCLLEGERDGSHIHRNLGRIVLPQYEESSVQESSPSLEKVRQFSFRVGTQKKEQKFENFIPFRLLISTTKVRNQMVSNMHENYHLLVLVVNSRGFKVFYERISSTVSAIKLGVERKSLTYRAPSPLSAIALSPNGHDIACGHWQGDILVLSNAVTKIIHQFDTLERGKMNESPKNLLQGVLTRKLHWHAHPVSTLSYQEGKSANPLLYSAGEESVLVVWQLGKGTSRPADTLPRLAKGRVAHILAAGERTTQAVLIYCEDNSLQLVAAHNFKLIWKVQGLSTCTEHTFIRRDSNLIVMTALKGATGCVSWYNPRHQVIEDQLDVAPFNRVSRTEDSDLNMPQPTITHTAFSGDMEQMLTVEAIATENSGIGRATKLGDNMIGIVTTIKFWEKNTIRKRQGKNSAYIMTASMNFPHGERHSISAVAMSKDGQSACTVSNDENAFRIWKQVIETDEDDNQRRRPVWICQYKVSTPSGFATLPTPSQGVDFSSDGSTLCITYGHFMTLWDHHDTTLLNTLQHFTNEPIAQMQFVKTGMIHDSVMSRSKHGVKLQSPYGHYSKSGWTSSVPDDDVTFVYDAKVINAEQIGISIYFKEEQRTKIIFVNSVTGDPISKNAVADIPFKVKSLVLAGPKFHRKQGFLNEEEILLSENEPPVRVFVTSHSGEMFLLQDEEDNFSLTEYGSNFVTNGERVIPKVHLKTNKRSFDEVGGNVNASIIESNSNVFFADAEKKAIETSELPLLSENIVRNFLSRHLSKRDQMHE
jgi:WD40 repeat protein